jgi:hypothetical protein
VSNEYSSVSLGKRSTKGMMNSVEQQPLLDTVRNIRKLVVGKCRAAWLNLPVARRLVEHIHEIEFSKCFHLCRGEEILHILSQTLGIRPICGAFQISNV